MALVPDNTLITGTPEEGRELALKMARLVVKATQPEEATRARLRPGYAESADSLIAVAHVVAVEFATIAAANDYWRNS
ncbi:hexameric tyrosine-coordinated heme protein [Streptomyces sp. FXJ1.4098]|uniref:hexameric tyrosine-coordinated heme protein n=1 Tax=Streptomyces sp. NPDC020845 TaxID=3365096 RepID=UPI002991FCC8|nr:hexameric tyrosine-coordinated heme protein [Streptomyces sp. FXJ1.4098]